MKRIKGARGSKTDSALCCRASYIERTIFSHQSKWPVSSMICSWMHAAPHEKHPIMVGLSSSTIPFSYCQVYFGRFYGSETQMMVYCAISCPGNYVLHKNIHADGIATASNSLA